MDVFFISEKVDNDFFFCRSLAWKDLLGQISYAGGAMRLARGDCSSFFPST